MALSVLLNCQTAQNKVVRNSPPANTYRLPLGDGKISRQPQRGFVWTCQQQFRPGVGAFREGDWIYSDNTFDPARKAAVDGNVVWDNFKFEINLNGNLRQIIGNSLPDHQTGIFPVRQEDDAYDYDRNPNAIKEIKIVFNLPANPLLAAAPSCLPMNIIGVMKTGAALFNAVDEAGNDAVAHEIQDKCDGHPEQAGRYHYHNLSRCIEDSAENKHSELIGYALDGFGIYGKRGENGQELSNRDLDECHGHTHEILWDNQKIALYHYHATAEYPYTIGCLKGELIDLSGRNQ